MRNIRVFFTPSYYNVLAFAVSVISILVTQYHYDLSWWTNDDVAMSMMSHGYGVFDSPDSKLIFSNIAWGYITTHIPMLFGYPGYSLATLLVLHLCGWGICYCLLKNGVGAWVSFFLLVIVMARPVLFPQFTVTAGLLTLTAVMLTVTYGNHKKVVYLIIAASLFVIANMIRDKEAWLVMLIALPLFPWAELARRRAAYVILICVIGLIMVLNYINGRAYSGEEWQRFNEFQKVRIQLIDYGGLSRLQKKPEIYLKHNYSENDLRLLRRWFFADPDIADVKKLTAMMEELDSVRDNDLLVEQTVIGFRAFVKDNILFFSLCCLVMFVWRGGTRVALASTLFFAAILYFAYIGRPGVLRVYLPVMTMLFLMPMIVVDREQQGQAGRRQLLILLILGGCYVYGISNESIERSLVSHEHNEKLEKFPSTTVAIAPGDVWTHYIYPLKVDEKLLKKYRFESLGWSYFAPSSVAMTELRNGNGFIERFTSRQGLSFVHGGITPLYKKYCEERISGPGSFSRWASKNSEYAKAKIYRANCGYYDNTDLLEYLPAILSGAMAERKAAK